jgi:hypothetical protein
MWIIPSASARKHSPSDADGRRNELCSVFARAFALHIGAVIRVGQSLGIEV